MNEPFHPSEPCSQRVCMVEFLGKMTIKKRKRKACLSIATKQKIYNFESSFLSKFMCQGF